MASDINPSDVAQVGGDQQQPLTITELTWRIKDLLEDSFPSVWVTGEISNFSRPQSGHCYLTLKDDSAQVRAVIWRSTAERLKFDLSDGLDVICHGNLDVYAPRGSYQLVIRQIHPKGVGALEQRLRKLKDKLEKEGLFDDTGKRPLPRFPLRIAVVTSPTGAAIHDFLEVLRRRWKGTDVLIVPVRVQGAGAAAIARAIRQVNRLKTIIDVLVVGRGGGSLEDLWAFNEEPVVRAIHASRIPVISAVGHEIDVTLSDLAADVRALTPSEAAERAVPDGGEIKAALRGLQQRLLAGLRGRSASMRSRLDVLAARRALRRPHERIHDLQRRLDELADRGRRAARNKFKLSEQRAAALAARLESLSPLSVLGRGYSVTQSDDGQLLRDASRLKVGDQIVTRFQRGQAVSRIEQIEID